MTDPRIQLPGTVPGIDLSGWNRVTDYDAIREDGVRFCWVKASEGRSHVSTRASEHVRGCEEAGIPSGVYHFARPDEHPDDPVREAEHMLRELDDLDARCLLPALDYEVDAAGLDQTAWVASFLLHCWERLDVMPVLYAGKLLRQGKVDLPRLAETLPVRPQIWSARYPTAKGTTIEVFQRLAIEQIDRGPRVPGWNVWQWSSSWSPRWSPGHIDVNAARDLDAIRWQS